MTNAVYNDLSFRSACVGDLSAFNQVVSSIVKETSYIAEKAIDFTGSVLFDCGRAVDYTTQWITDYSGLSPKVKQEASKVKGAVDRYNLVCSFCDAFSATKSLLTGSINSISDGIDSIGAYVGSSSDLAGRLDDLKMVSLGSAKPLIGGIGAVADSTVGLNGIRLALKNEEGNSDISSRVLNVAKNVTLAVLGALCAVASFFSELTVGCSYLPVAILATATTFLVLKTASTFYDKLALPMPLELASRV